MQTLTITQKLRKQRRPLNSLLALVALLFGLGASQVAMGQGFTSSSLVIAVSQTGASTTSTTYYGNNPTNSTPKFSTLNPLTTSANPIDPFNASGTLNITMVNDALNPRGTAILSSHFYYRVYLQTAVNKPAFTSVNLNLSSATNQDNPTTYSYNTPIDLLTVPRVNGGGTYVVEIYYDAPYQDPTDASYSGTATDPSGFGNPYTTTFDVAAPNNTPAGATTIWQSTSSTAWFNAANWSNGVPTGTSNAIIPENTQGTNIVFPVLNNRSLNYQVRNLTLNGTTNSGRAQLTIQQAVLHVYGNIQQLSGGLVGTLTDNPGVLDSTMNSTLMLRGANQFITGVLSVPDVIVSGTDIKSVANSLKPTNIIAFLPTTSSGVIVQSASAQNNQNGTVTYVFDTTGNSLVDLAGTGAISNEAIGRETGVSYIKGVVKAQRALTTGIQQTFGNIGIDYTSNHSVPLLTVQRIIGDPLLGPTNPTTGNTPVPIKRQYNIAGDDNSATAATAGSSNDIVFHYLDSVYELNSIMEANLTMFRTPTGGPKYAPIGGVLDQAANTVTRFALPSMPSYFLTLGDRTNPLPVTLTAFEAKRSAADALLTWQTASELNNSGFNVQVSTNGTEYRTLGFVKSANATSNHATSYSYTDTEKNKTGVRYYRLQQVDIDGKMTTFAPRSVAFDGKTATTGITAYPNPLGSAEQLHLNVQSAVAGSGQVRISDMTGRVIRQQTVSLESGTNDFAVSGLNDLKTGIYLVNFTLPSGEMQNLKVVKQ